MTAVLTKKRPNWRKIWKKFAKTDDERKRVRSRMQTEELAKVRARLDEKTHRYKKELEEARTRAKRRIEDLEKELEQEENELKAQIEQCKKDASSPQSAGATEKSPPAKKFRSEIRELEA